MPGRWWWRRRSCRRPGGARCPSLADSKLLTPLARERVYAEVVARALAYAVVVIPADDVDIRGLHVCNLAGMRRALAALARRRTTC